MKKLIALVICFMFLGIRHSFAETSQKHTWEVGTEISHITYKEPGVMKQKGVMSGILGSYTYYDNFMLKTEGRFSFGEVDYSSSSSGTMNDIDDYILEIRGLGGRDFPVFKDSTIRPYFGIGYRYLNDDMSGRVTTTGAGGYERESNYIYSPIGVEFSKDLDNDFSFGATLEYDYFWEGKQKSHLSDVPGYYDIENDQDEGYGWRGSLKFQKESEKIDYIIESFVRYWNIKESKTTTDPAGTSWVEPKNNSTEYGIKFTARF
ncbi:MAG: autotransporter domain-containing protein [Candidatus Omnitrophica bacterium]|nr:autotransporter domain-containing protein [Candidatus Omnitrophota bacterium]